jgi:Xaa-Pro aminopeptidase
MTTAAHRTARRALVALATVIASTAVLAQEAGRYGHYEVYDNDLVPREEYAARRQAVLAQLDDSAAMLVRSADESTRSNDVEYEYRQRNNMLYLSGVTETESALLLAPRGVRIGDTIVREVLFLATRNPRVEVFEGLRMGPEVGATVTGVRATLPYNRLNDVLDTLIRSLDTLYYDGWRHSAAYEPITGYTYFWEHENTEILHRSAPRLQVKDAGRILDRLRRTKSARELALLRRAIDISVEGHRATMRAARAGMHEYELEAVMEYTFRSMGAEDPGYPSIVGSGPNSCILHYSTNRRKTAPGEVVLMDCGAEYHGYSADVTRTIPIGGHFSPAQRAIYDLVLAAQTAGIDACRAGRGFRDPHTAAFAVIAKGLQELGITADEEDAFTYFNHGTSHYIGLDVHDVGAADTLAPGMVLTVEPGIYIPAGSRCDRRWWNIGVRIEDDILVTDGDPENLSKGAPRTADEIEREMSEDRTGIVRESGGDVSRAGGTR